MKQGDLLAYLWMTGKVTSPPKPHYVISEDDPEFAILIDLLKSTEYLHEKPPYHGVSRVWRGRGGLLGRYLTVAFVPSIGGLCINIDELAAVARVHQNKRREEVP